MKTYSFSVILGEPEMTETMADRLFECGLDDCLPGSCHGVVTVHIDREAETMEVALTTAVRQVLDAGYQVKRVEFDQDEVELLLIGIDRL